MVKNLPLSIETVPISPIYIAESSGCAGPPRGDIPHSPKDGSYTRRPKNPAGGKGLNLELA
jgi:hypothetical protein